MFSSNLFGQSSSSSSFGSQSAFGQPSNSNNPFAPKPFDSTTPFGAQTGGSVFGGTSTGVFGAQPSSPFSSTPTFGVSSSPAFGSSVPTFGATSTPGGATSAFGGQQPAFGSFGSPSPASPFGISSQPSQPAFGSNLFGSSRAFGASSQPAFGSTSTPAFGASAPGFATTGSSFGVSSTPAFGATTSAFGSAGSAFGSSTGGAFGASSSTPLFGSSTANAFGATSTPLFGAAGTPAFGASSSSPSFGATSTPAFGTSSMPAFGASSSPSFSFGSSPTFGQSTAAFGSSPFASTSSPFGSQPGTQATTPTFGNTGFGQSPFGGQRGGSRVTPYAPTTETDSSSGTQPAGKLESISAMPAYKDKSHEELRWEDYQLRDKGGPNPAAQSGGAVGFGATSSNPAFSQSSPFGSTTASNPFGSKPFGSTGFGSSPSISAFNAPTATTTPPFGSTSTPAFGATQPSIFSTAGTSAFGSTPSLFSSLPGSSSLNTGFPTQSTPLFSSTTPAFGQPGSGFGQTTSSFGQTTTPFGQTTASAFGQTNIFSPPSTGFSGNIFSSTPSLVPSSSPGFGQSTPSFATSFQPSQPVQATNAFGFGNLGQTQIAGPSFSAQNVFGQGNLGNTSANLSLATVQPAVITNPFGTLPAMPQISIGKTGTGSSIPTAAEDTTAEIEPESQVFDWDHALESPDRDHVQEIPEAPECVPSEGSRSPEVPTKSTTGETATQMEPSTSQAPNLNLGSDPQESAATEVLDAQLQEDIVELCQLLARDTLDEVDFRRTQELLVKIEESPQASDEVLGACRSFGDLFWTEWEVYEADMLSLKGHQHQAQSIQRARAEAINAAQVARQHLADLQHQLDEADRQIAYYTRLKGELVKQMEATDVNSLEAGISKEKRELIDLFAEMNRLNARKRNKESLIIFFRDAAQIR